MIMEHPRIVFLCAKILHFSINFSNNYFFITSTQGILEKPGLLWRQYKATKLRKKCNILSTTHAKTYKYVSKKKISNTHFTQQDKFRIFRFIRNHAPRICLVSRCSTFSENWIRTNAGIFQIGLLRYNVCFDLQPVATHINSVSTWEPEWNDFQAFPVLLSTLKRRNQNWFSPDRWCSPL